VDEIIVTKNNDTYSVMIPLWFVVSFSWWNKHSFVIMICTYIQRCFHYSFTMDFLFLTCSFALWKHHRFILAEHDDFKLWNHYVLWFRFRDNFIVFLTQNVLHKQHPLNHEIFIMFSSYLTRRDGEIWWKKLDKIFFLPNIPYKPKAKLRLKVLFKEFHPRINLATLFSTKLCLLNTIKTFSGHVNSFLGTWI
jgi:hypothetical protein